MTWEELITHTGRTIVDGATTLPGRQATPPSGHAWFRDVLEMQLAAVAPRRQHSARACPSEDDEQRALFKWRDDVGLPQEPLLDFLSHTNVRPQYSKRMGGKLKGLGVKKDMPDLFLSVARDGFHGLYIELKALDGTVPASQKALHARLREQGYRVAVAWGWVDAARELCRYLRRTDLAQQMVEGG